MGSSGLHVARLLSGLSLQILGSFSSPLEEWQGEWQDQLMVSSVNVLLGLLMVPWISRLGSFYFY